MSTRKRSRQTSATTDDDALPSLELSEQVNTVMVRPRRSTRAARARLDTEAAANEDEFDPALLKQQTRALFAHTLFSPPLSSSTAPVSASSVIRSSVRHLRVDGYAISHYLGRKVPIVNGGAVKGGVIAALSGTVPFTTEKYRDGHTPLPSFNRMCGINEWANAVCLFVNVQHKNRRYANDFRWNKDKTICTVAWFASPRQTVQTRVIQRLIDSRHIKREIKAETTNSSTSSDSSSSSSSRNTSRISISSSHSMPIKQETVKNEFTAVVKAEVQTVNAGIDGDVGGDTSPSSVTNMPTAVLLFCRLPQQPYVFCGSLSYVEHDAASSPVKFIWRLDDAAALQHCPDFQQLSHESM